MVGLGRYAVTPDRRDFLYDVFAWAIIAASVTDFWTRIRR